MEEQPKNKANFEVSPWRYALNHLCKEKFSSEEGEWSFYCDWYLVLGIYGGYLEIRDEVRRGGKPAPTKEKVQG